MDAGCMWGHWTEAPRVRPVCSVPASSVVIWVLFVSSLGKAGQVLGGTLPEFREGGPGWVELRPQAASLPRVGACAQVVSLECGRSSRVTLGLSAL